MILHEIGIGNYRSIGNDPVWINLDKKVNIFIGANNSGKSNILRAFYWLVQNKSLNKGLDQIELHQKKGENLLRISLKATFDESDGIPEVVDQSFILDFKAQGKQLEWLDGPFNINDDYKVLKIVNEFMKKYENQYFPRMPDKESFQKTKHKIYDRLCRELLQNLPSVFYIPQFRQITPGAQYSIKGEGIIEMLASWQHPEITKDDNYGRFLKIQNLLRRLLNSSDIQMEVVHSKDQIIVKNKNLRLPLESYGAGVHELIILAVAVYSHKGVILIEEPEIHLHPKLQREFLNFIINETDNNYLITTHSNVLLQPSSDIDVVHLTLTDDCTIGRRVESSANILEILNDLGISPSDILLANSVIWVEGPSDRIYLNKWINLLFPKLIEGIDYSIMFYGGKLLSHLSLDRDDNLPSLLDLVPLLRINQKSIIVIDSDRKKRSATISATKSRIKAECEQNNIYCWITDGKEIENYLAVQPVASAYKELTGIEATMTINRYDDLESVLQSAYGIKWKKSWSYDAAKPELARKIAKNFRIEDMSTDLKNHLDSVYKVITS
jgi:putative ATP-dependent endonuclease of OLD family